MSQLRLAQKHALKKEEERLVRALAALRAELNDYAPSAILPFQILADIFAICARSFFTKDEPKQPLAWTQVCRTWRYTALNAPSLWTRINISNSVYAREFLKRSGTVPIHLVSDRSLCTQATKVDLHSLQLSARRVNGITVDLELAEWENLSELLGPNLLHLDILDLTITAKRRPWPMISLIPPPGLKRLALRGTSIPLNRCFGLDRLTHICLDALRSLIELSTILEGSPCLEYVELIHLELDHGPPPPRAATLPNLRELSIVHSYPNDVQAVVNSIALLPTTRLYIDATLFLDYEMDHEIDLKPFFRSIMANITASYKAVRFAPFTGDSVQFLESATLPWTDGPIFSVVKAKIEAFHVSYYFDLTNLTALELDCNEKPQSHIMCMKHTISVFKYMPKLEILRVGTQHDVVKILADLANANIKDDPFLQNVRDNHIPMLCPRLRYLSFGHPTAKFPLEEQHCALLIRLVEARHFAAIPLENLEFIRADQIFSGLRDRFHELVTRGVVPSVVWRA